MNYKERLAKLYNESENCESELRIFINKLEKRKLSIETKIESYESKDHLTDAQEERYDALQDEISEIEEQIDEIETVLDAIENLNSELTYIVDISHVKLFIVL